MAASRPPACCVGSRCEFKNSDAFIFCQRRPHLGFEHSGNLLEGFIGHERHPFESPTHIETGIFGERLQCAHHRLPSSVFVKHNVTKPERTQRFDIDARRKCRGHARQRKKRGLVCDGGIAVGAD